jgi:hypothetical protein
MLITEDGGIETLGSCLPDQLALPKHSQSGPKQWFSLEGWRLRIGLTASRKAFY